MKRMERNYVNLSMLARAVIENLKGRNHRKHFGYHKIEKLTMETAGKKRKGYPTNPQKMRLIQLLQADDELRGGKFSATFTKKVAEARWTALALELNSIPGAKKHWTEWRRTWQDMKSKTKKKETAVRRCYNGTGGGPPLERLSGDEILILNTISKSELEGHSDIEESLVCFKDLPGSSEMLFPVTDLPVLPPTISDTLDEVATKCNNIEEETTIETVRIPETNDGSNKENINMKKTFKKKTSGKKRLDSSIESVNALKETLDEKNKYKKIFYENYIIEMRRQTDALLLIANNLKKE